MVSSRSTLLASIFRGTNLSGRVDSTVVALEEQSTTIHTTPTARPRVQAVVETSTERPTVEITTVPSTDLLRWSTTFAIVTASTPGETPPNNGTLLVIVLVSTLGGVIFIGLIFLFLLR